MFEPVCLLRNQDVWIIQVLAGRNEAVRAHKRFNPQEFALSYLTLGEIYEVAFNSTDPQERLQTFHQFIAPFTLLDLQEPLIERFAEIRSLLRRRGQLISDFDLLKAATALLYDLTLLTYN